MLYFLIAILIIYFLIPSKKIKFGIFRFKNYIVPLCIIIILIFLVVFSEDVFDSAHNGLVLWVNNVVPSLFPFLICLEVLKRTNIINVIGRILEPVIRPVFNIPGSGAFAVVMGMCSGYPVGAKFAASIREENQCSSVEGERLLAFTNTSGPLFIVGAVGIGMFADSKIGFLLLITHFISAIIVGILFRFYGLKHSFNNVMSSHNESFQEKLLQKKLLQEKDEPTAEKNKSSDAIKLSQLGGFMGDAIRNSISTLLLICGFIVFFCVLGTILDKSGVTNTLSEIISNLFIGLGFSIEVANDLATSCFKGILEITSGLKLMANISLDYKVLLPLVALILGFGGISVHMQVASIISNTNLSIKPYLIGKTLHGIFAGIITYLTLNYTNFLNLEAIETFSAITANNVTSISGGGNVLIIALALLILASLLVLLLRRNTYVK